MSKYTTGEIAKLCGVSVRTVQYYDTRGILIPSELSEGGRRLYTEDDLKRLKLICFLRGLDLPISSIGELLDEEHPENVIDILLEEQEKALGREIREKQAKLETLEGLRKALKKGESLSAEAVGDIAKTMENRKKLKQVHGIMLAVGIVMDAIEIATLIYWIRTKIWQPFALGMCAVIAMAAYIFLYWSRKTAYICPECHEVFKPGRKEAFFAAHTSTTRKLTCTKCGHKGFCVEVYGEE